jgi:NNP family nitrate/nitrite transporter-like MFS transporter
LVLATAGFMVNFWAWALLGPLGPGVKERLGLSFALSRFSSRCRSWSDRSADTGRCAHATASALASCSRRSALATLVPVLTLAFVSSYPALIVTGFFLGIGGTAFAVGVPLVSGWYPPARRGFAIGVFGVGMGGTAIANFTTVKLATRTARRRPSSLSRRSSRSTPLSHSCWYETPRTAATRRRGLDRITRSLD